jgi:hypothetical protein
VVVSGHLAMQPTRRRDLPLQSISEVLTLATGLLVKSRFFANYRGVFYTMGLMCSRCDGFLERRRVNSPYEYRDLVRQILEVVQQSTLRLVRGTCPLEVILTSPTWPSDVITHTLECTTCSRRFKLAVETYHGSGGTWEVMTSPPQSLKPQ